MTECVNDGCVNDVCVNDECVNVLAPSVVSSSGFCWKMYSLKTFDGLNSSWKHNEAQQEIIKFRSVIAAMVNYLKVFMTLKFKIGRKRREEKCVLLFVYILWI